MRDKAGMKFDCILEETLDFIDIDYTNLNKTIRYEQRPHGEWIACASTRNGQITNIDYKCSECSHHKDRPMPYCEICGAKMKRSKK